MTLGLPSRRDRPKSNQELFEVVEAARVQKDFAGALNELGFDDLRRIDKYLDTIMHANAEGSTDHNLWKQVRDELANRLIEQGGEVQNLALNVGEKSKALIGAMQKRVSTRVADLLAA